MATRVCAHGRRQGVFQATVPPDRLGRAIEAQLLALLDCVDLGLWSDDATAALIAAGVAPDTAAAKVDQARKADVPPLPGALL